MRMLMLLRVAAIVLLATWAWRRRSLTLWIVVGMAAGAEIGHDYPDVARQLRVLAQIVLRLQPHLAEAEQLIAELSK